MKTLLVTACGLSSRFEGLRPKWMLTHPIGELMLARSISGLGFDSFDKICFSFLKEHFDKYECLDGIKKCIKELGISSKSEIKLFPHRTKDQAQTVYESIGLFNIKGSFLVKEVDNYFEHNSLNEDNTVCYSDLNDTTRINPTNKGYVVLNKDKIQKMVEKKVVSTTFSCGAYQFRDADYFRETYRELSETTSENLYLSTVIDFMISKGEIFRGAKVKDYIDWGTKEDWLNYCNEFATIFCDLDGTLLTSSGEYFKPYWEEAKPIQENVDKLNQLHDSGKAKIIITTARKKKFKTLTIEQLEKYNIKYHELIIGLNHCQRILINDFAPSNPYPSATALNLKRNDNNLSALLNILHD